MTFKKSKTEKSVDIIIYTALVLITFATLYPFLFVFSASISDPHEILAGNVILWPKGFSLEAYKMIFQNENIWRAYYNTIWYTVVGVTFNVILVTSAGYALSRKEFFLKNKIMVFVTITMFFKGGLVPLFILVNKLGLYNTRWAIVLPLAANAWNLIITRVYFQSTIPPSLPEAAKIEGCNDIHILYKIVLPVSLPIIATITLFTAVRFWNSYLPALLYLPTRDLQPISILLRNLLILNQVTESTEGLSLGYQQRIVTGEMLKYSMIIMTILPIMCIYPFLQKYFVKGIMIGSIKE